MTVFYTRQKECGALFGRFRLQDLKLQNIIFYAIALAIVVMIITQQGSLESQRQAYDKKLKQLETTQQYNAELQEKNDYVGTEAYREEKAREEGYVEEDEIVFITSD